MVTLINYIKAYNILREKKISHLIYISTQLDFAHNKMKTIQILLIFISLFDVFAAPDTPLVDVFSREGRQLSFQLPGAESVPIETITTSAESVKSDIVNYHNQLRRTIKATNMLQMTWNNEAADLAQKWGNGCVYMHDSNEQRKTTKFPCGQNIAKSTHCLSWKLIMDLWWGENKYFKFGQQPTGVVGHFTQMAWAVTHELGCAVVKCKGFCYYVCNYCPAGNMQGKETTPYIAGENCAACPKNCQNKLCTNACQNYNIFSNCEELNNQMHLCQSSQWPDHKSKCQATCNCKGKAIY